MRPCDPQHIRVDEWGVILSVDTPVADATLVGIRAHHVQLLGDERGENTFACEIVDAIESPFEVTVYARVNGATLEAEMPLADWSQRERCWIRLEPKHLLLLRD